MVTGTVVVCAPVAGAIEAIVGPCTVNVTVPVVVPIGVVTVMVLADRVAPVVMVKVAVTVVSFTTARLPTVTPVPDTLIAVAPVRPRPVRVTGTLVPLTPVGGAMELSVGPVTVKVTVLLVPPGVVTLTVLALSVAPAVMVKFAVTVVEFTTVMPPAVTPVPDTVTADVPVRFVPVKVTGTLVPLMPVLGAIEVSVGVGGAVTVNTTLPVVPIGVTTATFLAERVAPAAIVNVVVTVVGVTVKAPTVIPVPDTVTAVAPVRPVPLRVTGTLVPLTPVAGAIEDRPGPWTVNVTVLLVPPNAVTVTVLALSVAVAVMTRFAVTVVSFTTERPLTETPVPDTVTAEAVSRLVPVKVTGTVVPRTPVLGAIEVRVGVGGLTTVNGTVPLVPPGVVTLTFLAVSPAVVAIAKVAVTVVLLTAVTPLTVMPKPDTITAVAPVRLVPVRVTGTL
jgi:hypothetical protein